MAIYILTSSTFDANILEHNIRVLLAIIDIERAKSSCLIAPVTRVSNVQSGVIELAI
jgi:hypothetical protein